MPEGYTRVGKITRAVGLKGELKVTVDSRQALATGALLFVFPSGEVQPLTIISSKPDQAQFRFQFAEVQDRTAAERLRGLDLFIAGEVTLPAKPWEDVLGWEAHDKSLGLVGVIEEVLDYPGQFIARVRRAGGEVLIPLRDELIVKKGKGEVVFDLPEGLLEL